MKVIIAPDSFKGSLSAREAAEAIRDGILRALPVAETVLIPLADGGEGTVEALVTATGGQVIRTPATDPLGRPIESFFGMLGGDTAVVEMAAASGLTLIPPDRRNPMLTTSYGTGELIRAALDGLSLWLPEKPTRGDRSGASWDQDPSVSSSEAHRATVAPKNRLVSSASSGTCIERRPCSTTYRGSESAPTRHIILGLGGSATNDGGIGMIRALGGRFLDENGEEVGPGGGELARIRHIDLSGLDPRIAETEFVAASDVDNPLTGLRGASAVFGPQKGATPEMVSALDAGLHNLAEVIRRDLGMDIEQMPGAGAAGGLGASAVVFLGAELRSGIEIVLDAAHFAERIRGAWLVITGEGRIDAQTLAGKTISGVLCAAAVEGVPVVALGGGVEPDGYALLDQGAAAVVSIADRPMSLEEAQSRAEELLSGAAEQVMRLSLLNITEPGSSVS